MRIHLIQEYLQKSVRFILLFLFCILFLQQCVVTAGYAQGVSMEPAVFDGQRFLIERYRYFLHPPNRYDIVQFFDPSSEQKIVKRIVGIPGDTVVIENGMLTIINSAGENIFSEMIAESTQRSVSIIEKHEYFLLGDNRSASIDSRTFGTIHRKYIYGKIRTL